MVDLDHDTRFSLSGETYQQIRGTMSRELKGREFKFDAGYGEICVVDNEVDGPAVLFIHGNSGCKEVFCHQFNSSLATQYRMIAFDLPGHGASDDAAVPDDVYRMATMTLIIRKLLEVLDARDAVLVGWSLGGHLAIELAGTYPEHKGMVITGTPPFGPGRGEIALAFNATEEMALTDKEDFDAADAALYAEAILGKEASQDKTYIGAVLRTDGIMRAVSIGDWAMNDDAGLYHKTVVAEWKNPIAVIQGEREPFVNKDWMKDVTWGNLWKGQYHVVEGTGHAAFLECPKDYNELLQQYLKELFA